jgi:hypothetical protein
VVLSSLHWWSSWPNQGTDRCLQGAHKEETEGLEELQKRKQPTKTNEESSQLTVPNRMHDYLISILLAYGTLYRVGYCRSPRFSPSSLIILMHVNVINIKFKKKF